MTFVDGRPLTSAQLNTHVRDNMMETEVAKATKAGGYFCTETPGNIKQRLPRKGYISTFESVSATGWQDMATPGPICRLECGTQVAIFVSARIVPATSDFGRCGVKVEGATDRQPEEGRCLLIGASTTNGTTCQSFWVLQGLTPGDHTFTMQYSTVFGGSASIGKRRLIVVPF